MCFKIQCFLLDNINWEMIRNHIRYYSHGCDLVPSLPVGVSEIWMETGTFTSQTGADGIWPSGMLLKWPTTMGTIFRAKQSGCVLHHL